MGRGKRRLDRDLTVVACMINVACMRSASLRPRRRHGEQCRASTPHAMAARRQPGPRHGPAAVAAAAARQQLRANQQQQVFSSSGLGRSWLGDLACWWCPVGCSTTAATCCSCNLLLECLCLQRWRPCQKKIEQKCLTVRPVVLQPLPAAVASREHNLFHN